MKQLTAHERELLKKVELWLEEHQEELERDIVEWVRIPSVRRDWEGIEGAPFGRPCAEVLELALKRGAELGFRTENHQGYAGSILYGNHERDIGVVGHLDVVPEGDHWIYPPYEPTKKGDFLIGRGVSDNKGASVAGLYTVRILRDLQIPLEHNIRIIYGCAEETGMDDLAYFVKHEPVPEVSLVIDGAFPLNNGQKGGFNARLFIPVGKQLGSLRGGTAENNVPDYAQVVLQAGNLDKVQSALTGLPQDLAELVKAEPHPDGVIVYARGRAGHAAFPEGSLNAIWVLAEALKLSGQFEEDDRRTLEFLSSFLADYYGEGAGIASEDDLSGKLTLNGGIIRPYQDGLELFVDIRYPVTGDAETVKQRLEQRITPYGVHILDVRNSNPYYIAKDDPKVQTLLDAYNSIRNEQAEPYVMGGGTHSRVLPGGITFGPGFPSSVSVKPDFLPPGHGHAHGPDEALHLPSLLEAIKIYVLALIWLDKTF
ncbi:Sapep family Mn(2+)-dependent dipeptidase [Paenibacillus sp. CN-4]|uniref:Sapep family Mn(2+)-dependent dipeptidase n=1 Tax=Paenibacillus nanchangensis TaxID=3348343 RepID=UPI00397D2191